MRLRLLTTYTLLLLTLLLNAATYNRTTYYTNANGKSGAALKTSLYGIIGSPSVKDYSDLWKYYYQTDRGSNNEVIDRYCNTVRYFGSSASSNAVGGMNKEHGMPQSWWSNSTMKSDLHHVMPSDETANNKKANYGMGVVSSQSWSNGSIKVGTGKGGDNGTISLWEPANKWKGDFARVYFYMVTCYEQTDLTKTEGAKSCLTGSYPKLQSWAVELYMKWSREDPVDDMERQRNNAVYNIQGNRNPFIDMPGLEQYIWGSKKTTAVSIANYVNPNEGETPDIPDDPDDPDTPDTPDDPDTPATGDIYVKLTTAPADWTGTYLIVYEAGSLAFNGSLSSIDAAGNYISVSIANGTIAVTDQTENAEFQVAKSGAGYSFLGRSGQYMGTLSTGNKLTSSTSPIVNALSMGSDGVNIKSDYNTYLRYNTGGTRFRYYSAGSQQPVQLYRRTEAPDGIRSMDNGQWTMDNDAPIFDLQGRRVKRMRPGHLYIVDGRKVYCKAKKK